MSSASSRSSGHPTAAIDPLTRALRQATASVLKAVAAVHASNPVIVIDGRSGAGKSSLARALVANWPTEGRVQLVALDSMYPGWDGLEAGAETARTDILIPHARDTIGVWRRHDWETGTSAEAFAVDPSLPLIVEGSGILTAATRSLADVAVWVEAPDESRQRRALDRDGELYRPHWSRWARQEAAHIARDSPHAHASVVVTMP